MNWAPPHVTIPPPDTSSDSPEPVDTVCDESPAERRHRSAVPAAAWIALLGSALILIAAAAVVASNWSAIGEGLRVAGLIAVTAALLVIAERSRVLVPTTAGIIAHAGTFLVAFTGIAAMSAFGFTWPVCLVVGGGAVIVATELQARRWRKITMHLGQVAGFATAATGIAALAGTTAGLVAMIASVGLLAAGGQRRSVGLSMLAVFSPVLTALADAGLGSGTLERAGLVGERLSWSGPIVGLLAATVIGAVSMNRKNNPLMLVAAVSPVLGAITGLSALDGSAVAWWSVPAMALIAAELGWWMMPTDRFRTHVGIAITIAATGLAGLAWLSPALVNVDLFDSGLAHPWAIPTAVTALAVALTTLRWRSADSVMTDLGITAVLAAGVGTLVALDASNAMLAVAAIAGTAGAAFLSRRLGVVAIHATAFWALVSIVDTSPTLWSLVLLAALVAIVAATRARLAAANEALGWLELGIVAAAIALAAIEIMSGHAAATALIAVSGVVLVAVLIDRRLMVWGVATIGAAGTIALAVATGSGDFDPSYTLGWAGATVTFVALWLAHRSPIMSFAAASAAVLTLATSAAWFGVTAEDVTVITMLAVAALTGLAFTMERRTPLDAAAITAGCVLLAATSFDIGASWVSGMWVVIGLQVAAYGLITRLPPVALGGWAVAFAGATSWVFTTGLDEWLLKIIEPADITVGDLWLAAASIGALLAGLTLRTVMDVNSWLAYSASLAIPGLWLTSVHLDRDVGWAVPLLLMIGIAAAGAGAWQRLAAPLVGGTALTAVGVFLATGSDLTAIPTWVWLAIGGLALLSIAVLIERNGKPGAPDLRDLVSRWN